MCGRYTSRWVVPRFNPWRDCGSCEWPELETLESVDCWLGVCVLKKKVSCQIIVRDWRSDAEDQYQALVIDACSWLLMSVTIYPWLANRRIRTTSNINWFYSFNVNGWEPDVSQISSAICDKCTWVNETDPLRNFCDNLNVANVLNGTMKSGFAFGALDPLER